VEFSEGRRDSVKALHAVLVAVGGGDYVPENLRSAAFTRVASSVISAHQGMDNFYNEPAPMRELASLGTSIPGPALAVCMTAVLCVKLGNAYGTSHAAQPYADQVLSTLSSDRWLYYLNECLAQDRVVLAELCYERPANNWSRLVRGLEVEITDVTEKDVRALFTASWRGEVPKVRFIADKLLKGAIGA